MNACDKSVESAVNVATFEELGEDEDALMAEVWIKGVQKDMFLCR